MDIRLKEIPYTLGEREYKLRCNMNVLADVQEAYGGEIASALNGKSGVKSIITFMAAMLNDYADEMGWEERYTPKQVGRLIKPTCLKQLSADVMGLVATAMQAENEESEKN